MKSILQHSTLAAALALVSGCAAPSKGPVKLPHNYGEESNMRKLVLVCSFSNQIDEATGLADLAPNLSTFMQAELGQINRFTVYCIWNDGGYRLAKDLAAHGEAAPMVEAPPAIDLILAAQVTATTGKATLRSGNIAHSYQVQAAVELQDSFRNQLWGGNYLGGKVYRTERVDSNGTPMQGPGFFNSSSRSDVHKVLDESSRVLLYDLVSELGHHYPITGRVTGLSGTSFGVDKGAQDGVGREMEFTIWSREPSNVDIAIFRGVAQAGGVRSTIDVGSLDSGSEAAQAIVAAMRTDPNWIEKNPDRLFATSQGLGVPPDWSQRSVIEAKYAEYER